MKTIHLPSVWIDRLVSLPETGMGYQKVDFLLKDGGSIDGITVLNAEECSVPESFDPSAIVDVRLAGRD